MSTNFVFLNVDNPELFKKEESKSLVQSHVGKFNRLNSKTHKTSGNHGKVKRKVLLRAKESEREATIPAQNVEASQSTLKRTASSSSSTGEAKEDPTFLIVETSASPPTEVIQILPVSQQMDYGSSPTIPKWSDSRFTEGPDEDDSCDEEGLFNDWVASVLFYPGQGRVDPFARWAVETDDSNLQISQLVDHATSRFWSLLTPQDKYGVCNPVNGIYLDHMRHSTLVFYCYTIAVSHNFDFLSNLPPAAKQYRSLRAKHLHIATKSVRRYIEQLPANPTSEQIPDELIGCVVVLAGNYRLTVYNNEYGPKSKFRSPLATLQCLDMWGLVPLLPPHRLAVIQLVNLKGGLRGMQSEHLAGVVQLTDLLDASRYSTKPMLPWENMGLQLPIPKWPIPPIDESSKGSPILAKAFESLPSSVLNFQALGIAISTIAHTIEHLAQYFLDGCPPSAMLLLCESRNRAQYYALSLPTLSSILSSRQAHVKQAAEGLSNLERYLYEVTRLTLLIFNNIVVYPLPPYAGVDTRLSRLLRHEIYNALTNEPDLKHQQPELLLWALILGGISDHHNLQRSWYVEEARDILNTAPRLRRWINMEESLTSFLWSDFVLNEETFKFWLEVSYVTSPGTNENEKRCH